MKLIRTHKIFRTLGNLSVFRRKELRADRGHNAPYPVHAGCGAFC